MTWAWYTSIMSSGGVALVLYDLPYGFPGLWILGGIIYLASLVGFFLLLATHIVRFLLNPRLIRTSAAHPSEGPFVSTFAAALGILIIDGATYAEKMHTAHGTALRASFWIFLVVSVIFGVGSPLALFSKAPHAEQQSRGWEFLSHCSYYPRFYPAYPSNTRQSLSNFIDRLYHYSVPSISQRPSMYVAVGPPAFSALSFALLAEQCLRHFPAEKTAPGGANEIVGGVALYYILLTLSLMFWGLSLWLFLISTCSTLGALGQLGVGVQRLQLFALIFPNVGFALATIHLSRLFGHPKVLAITSEVLSLMVIGDWAIVVLAICYGVLSGRIIRTV
ncbi:hypothetical protein C7212DRAFT_343958 [Tuber magnatum]|uniref:C4-dicarboxylate transporter/malic acid transport protein n=1 Tax=Tuber magnatum TaxID=42249 RepID=A0A317SR58_9PEZI|nr:hypothetical protein C7212DRAFT_343958 [Tuber magnatum]